MCKKKEKYRQKLLQYGVGEALAEILTLHLKDSNVVREVLRALKVLEGTPTVLYQHVVRAVSSFALLVSTSILMV